MGIDPADARFAANALRLAHLEELHRVLAAALAARPVAEWLALLAGAGVPAGRVKSLDEVYDGGLLAWEVDHPALGRIRLSANPLKLQPQRGGSRAAAAAARRAHRPGRQAVTSDPRADAR